MLEGSAVVETWIANKVSWGGGLGGLWLPRLGRGGTIVQGEEVFCHHSIGDDRNHEGI